MGAVGIQTFQVGASVSEPGWTVPRGGAPGVGSAGKPIKRCEPSHWNLNVFNRAWGQEAQIFLDNKLHLVAVWWENGNKYWLDYLYRKHIHRIWLNTSMRLWKNVNNIFLISNLESWLLQGNGLKYLYLEIFCADYCFRGRINESVLGWFFRKSVRDKRLRWTLATKDHSPRLQVGRNVRNFL